MKQTPPFSSRRRFCPPVFAAGISLTLLLGAAFGGAPRAVAQDKIITANQTYDGKIVGVSGPNVQIQMGAGELSVALNTVRQVVKAAPPEFDAVSKLVEAGKYAEALAPAQKLAGTFKGLPIEWARLSASRVGDIQVALGKLDDAEKSYQDYLKLYPGAGSMQTEIGMARIALAKKNTEAAKAKLAPLVEEGLKLKVVPPEKAVLYSQAVCLLGEVDEAAGELPAALENYLRCVTLFYADAPSVAKAREKAGALQKADPTVVVP